jgi:hypothetical protein
VCDGSTKGRYGVEAFVASKWYDFDIVIGASSVTAHVYPPQSNTASWTKVVSTNLPAVGVFGTPFLGVWTSDKSSSGKSVTVDYLGLTK